MLVKVCFDVDSRGSRYTYTHRYSWYKHVKTSPMHDTLCLRDGPKRDARCTHHMWKYMYRYICILLYMDSYDIPDTEWQYGHVHWDFFENDDEQRSKSLYHSMKSCLWIRIPRSWIIVFPNILGSFSSPNSSSTNRGWSQPPAAQDLDPAAEKGGDSHVMVIESGVSHGKTLWVLDSLGVVSPWILGCSWKFSEKFKAPSKSYVPEHLARDSPHTNVDGVGRNGGFLGFDCRRARRAQRGISTTNSCKTLPWDINLRHARGHHGTKLLKPTATITTHSSRLHPRKNPTQGQVHIEVPQTLVAKRCLFLCAWTKFV